jgi:hypothetical protein
MHRSAGLLLTISILISIASAAAFGAAEPYQEIRVLLPTEASLRDLMQNQDLDLIRLGDGDAQLVSRPSITDGLIAKGWKVDVIHADLESFYASRQAGKLDYGVWHTYAETLAEMNLLHTQYPNLISAPFSIGVTGEGRSIWAIKLSDNVAVDEDEPEVLIDGAHHAREIMPVEMSLYFPRYLCENYGTDPTATFLVDNREFWFIPIVNVDGFVYNETTNPNSGGMWRKNRRNNGDGSYGVDINRNYPYMWGYDDSGSSPTPSSDTYRGPSAGSEPEVQAYMNFVKSRHFLTHDSLHSYGGMILFPWGYTLTHSPDDAALRAVATERATQNGYSIGQAGEILYAVNGGNFDWMYGEQTLKAKIFSFSTEFGGSGFWPDPSERDGLIAENMHSLIYLSQVAGPSASTTALAISGGDGNGRLDPGETVDLLATVKNTGIAAGMTNLVIRIRCDDPYVGLVDVSNAVGSLAAGASFTNSADPFNVQIEAGCPVPREITFVVVADADAGVHSETPFVFVVGPPTTIVANDFEEAGEAWTQDATHTATTGAFVRIDPVATTHQPGDDTTPSPGVYAWITAQNPTGQVGVDDVDGGIAATRSPDYNLSAYGRVRLSMNYFHGQRDTGGDSGDFFKIDVSPNGGGSWVNLVQIGDVATSPVWRNLSVNLGDYITLTSQVRFRVQAADGTTVGEIIEGGIDDFYLYDDGIANGAPSTPVLYAPANGATGVAALATLTVTNATDPEAETVTYGFRIYSDSDLTQLVRSTEGVAQGGAGTTAWTVSTPLPQGTYYWRSFAADPQQRSLFMQTASFTVTEQTGVEDLAFGNRPALTVGPNPAQAGTTIRYLVPATTTSRLAVYDPQGRIVRSFETAPSASGWHEVTWDGRDDGGRPVASGSYWVRLWTPGEMRTVRVVTIR